MSTLQQELLPAIAEGFFDLFFVLIDGGDVSIGMSGDPVEVAKLAIRNADIRGIDIPVDDPGNLVIGMQLFPDLVGNILQLRRGSMEEQVLPFFRGEEFEAEGAV